MSKSALLWNTLRTKGLITAAMLLYVIVYGWIFNLDITIEEK
jgi:hypothetical protein